MKCRACGRALKNPAYIAAGIGPVCAKKQRRESEPAKAEPRVAFMSSPKTTAADRRSFMVKFTGEFWRTVRIFPEPAGTRIARCDCPEFNGRNKCRHITAAIAADLKRFPRN